MGPYCKYCDRRCFTHLPAGTPAEAVEAYGTATIIATCRAGQDFELKEFGWCYDRIMAAIGAAPAVTPAAEPAAHTPEPWHLSRHGVYIRKAYPTLGDGPKDFNIAELNDAVGPAASAMANARRIVAAVNAAAGVPTAVLDRVTWAEMALALESAHRLLGDAVQTIDDEGLTNTAERFKGEARAIGEVLGRLKVDDPAPATADDPG